MSELTKKEALKYLEISERTLERWVKKYKIAVRYENTEHGRQPFFSTQELERVKKEQRSPILSPAITTDLASSTVTQEERKLIQFWAETSAHTSMVQRLNYQLTLGLNEAKILSGLSKLHLVKAAKSGNLNAQKIGREWKFRNQDLKEYVDGLFSK